MNEEETTHNPRSEWISFGILVAVLVITMLVVAVSRPLIFGRIVPAIIGDSSPRYEQAAPAPQVEEPAEEAAPAEEPSEEPAAETTPEETAPEAPSEAEPAPENTETVEEEPAATETENTPTTTTETEAPPTTSSTADEPAAGDNSFTYTVRAGDTLYQIARRFGTTSEDIIAATDGLNSLDDVIVPGMEIVIPRR